ncbi:hypothetical protein MalM14_21780 [Gimesia chilikensis]|nr:hypothetical protein MalM14_21780 [Gimesia chilikensis]
MIGQKRDPALTIPGKAIQNERPDFLELKETLLHW